MKVFLPLSTEQDLIIRPRAKSAMVNVYVRSELKDVVTNLTDILTFFSAGYLRIPITYPFSNGVTYEMEVTDQYDTLLWRGKAFCTSQTTQYFKIIT